MKAFYPFSVVVVLLFGLFSCKEVENAPQDSSSSFPIISAENAGVVEDSVLQYVNALRQKPGILGMVVIKNDGLLVEQYWNGASRADLHHIRSITKSISASLIGIAHHDGLIPDLNANIAPYFTDYISETRSDMIHKVSIQHVLDMTSGFDWDENQESTYWYTSLSDTWSYFFQKQVTTTPGTEFNYNSGAVSLLSRVIDHHYEDGFQKYAENQLLTPLGIGGYRWEKDGIGNTRADAGLQLRTLDLATYGYMMLNGGKTDGKQIVNPNWIDSTFTFKIDLQSEFEGITELHYNNLWWMGKIQAAELFFGLGYGGQLLYCIPEFETVIAVNHAFLAPTFNEHHPNFVNTFLVPFVDHLQYMSDGE